MAIKRQWGIFRQCCGGLWNRWRFVGFEFFVLSFRVHTSYMMHNKRTASASLTISHYRLHWACRKKLCVQINKSNKLNKYSLPSTHLNRIPFLFHLGFFSHPPAPSDCSTSAYTSTYMICDSSGYVSVCACLRIRQSYGPQIRTCVNCEMIYEECRKYFYKHPNGTASHIF